MFFRNLTTNKLKLIFILYKLKQNHFLLLKFVIQIFIFFKYL